MTRRRKKVVLYNPRAVFFTMPLGLLAIGSELNPEEYEVVIIDGRIDANPEESVVAALEGAVCLGVTVLTGAPIADALAMCRTAKAAHPGIPIIWGGWHPSMFGKECLLEPCVDVTVQAQGEATFKEIVSRLANGRSLDGCLGCMFRDTDGTVRVNPPRPFLPLDVFRPHDYELTPIERYFDLKGKRQLDYVSSQGCNFRCAFCSDPFVYGRKWTGIDPNTMVARLCGLWNAYGFDDVSFQDETFFTNRERIHAMTQGLADAGSRFTWAATMRADQGTRLPNEIWELCKASGLRRLLVGVESGDDEMLKRIKKDIKIDQVFYTAERMLALHIAGIFPFIVGFPGESDSSVEATIACANKLRAMSDEFETPIFYFKPYPGSEIVADAVSLGYQLPDTLTEWSTFDYVAGLPGPWVTDEKYRLIERFKFYLEVASKRGKRHSAWLRYLAQLRCDHMNFRWPLEMHIMRWAWPAEKLS